MVEKKYLLLIGLFFTSLNVNNASYCVVSANSAGILVVDPVLGKDSPFAAETSHFLGNTTKLNFIESLSQNSKFEKYVSIKRSNLINQPVLDQRWESFLNNHNHPHEISKILNNPETNIFLSFRDHQNFHEKTDYTQQQWRHVMANNSGLYNCSDTQTCSTLKKLASNSVDFYHENGLHLWRIHNYTYFYTRKKTEEQIYRSNDTKCTVVNTGCVYIFVAMCTNCRIKITVSTNNNLHSPPKIISGNQFWKTEQIPLVNSSSCPSIKVKTYTEGNDAPQDNFWAVGDVAYFSSNVTCEKNKRYINLNELALEYNSTAMYCESALNEKINTMQVLCPPVAMSAAPSNKSVYIPIYLLIIISLVLVIVACLVCFFVSKRLQNIKTKPPSVGHENENTQEVLLVNTREGPKQFTIDSWESTRRNEFTICVHDKPNRGCL